MWNGLTRYGLRRCWRQRTAKRSKSLSSVLHEPRIENVQVTCGSSGHVTLSIHTPTHPTSSTPLILYISCPFPQASTPDTDTTAEALPSTPPKALLGTNTVVQINPRWSSSHPFPFPIHDTLFAYTWIVEHLLPPRPSPSPSVTSSSPFSFNPYTAPAPPPRPLGIYGTGLGGTLATSLALTESRPSGPSPAIIAALAVRDAIFDWTRIASWTSPPLDKKADPYEGRLWDVRESLFRKPAAAWDSFASPLLFFRTSGLAIPGDWEGVDRAEAGVMKGTTRRAHLVFPPRKSGLRIPDTKIAVSSASGDGVGDRGGKGKRKGKGKGFLEGQAEEMVRLMRRSVGLHEGGERRVGLGLYGNGNDEWWDSDAEAEERVESVQVSGDDEGEWAREFFEGVLGRG